MTISVQHFSRVGLPHDDLAIDPITFYRALVPGYDKKNNKGTAGRRTNMLQDLQMLVQRYPPRTLGVGPSWQTGQCSNPRTSVMLWIVHLYHTMGYLFASFLLRSFLSFLQTWENHVCIKLKAKQEKPTINSHSYVGLNTNNKLSKASSSTPHFISFSSTYWYWRNIFAKHKLISSALIYIIPLVYRGLIHMSSDIFLSYTGVFLLGNIFLSYERKSKGLDRNFGGEFGWKRDS